MSAKVFIGAAIAIAGSALFAGLVLAGCSSAFAPVAKRLAAPLVCPGGYQRSIVVQHIWSPEPGTTNFESDLYCMKASGRPVMASAFRTFVALWGIESATLFILAVAAVAAGKALSTGKTSR